MMIGRTKMEWKRNEEIKIQNEWRKGRKDEEWRYKRSNSLLNFIRLFYNSKSIRHNTKVLQSNKEIGLGVTD
jgi:hypothetical protein